VNISFCFAADPYSFYNFEVSYITASPLGVPQQVSSSSSSSRSLDFYLLFLWIYYLGFEILNQSLGFSYRLSTFCKTLNF